MVPGAGVWRSLEVPGTGAQHGQIKHLQDCEGAFCKGLVPALVG